MTLTEEQRRRMEENRIRALQIKRTRELEKEQRERNSILSANGSNSNIFHDGGFVPAAGLNKETTQADKKSSLNNNSSEQLMKNPKIRKLNDKLKKDDDPDDDDDDQSSLEEFEQNASPYITQTEAQRSYCLPLGTLAVCSYIERDNPHKRGWSKMKLYARREVRRRARQRFGGKVGLIQERESRKRKRLEKDLEEMKDVFCSR